MSVDTVAWGENHPFADDFTFRHYLRWSERRYRESERFARELQMAQFLATNPEFPGKRGWGEIERMAILENPCGLD